MSADSKDSYDVFKWIKNKVIPSIVNLDHINGVKNLISNFERMYPDQTLIILLLNDELNKKKKDYGII